MSLSPFLVYLAMQMDALHDVLVLSLFGFAFLLVITGMAVSDCYTEAEKALPRRRFKQIFSGIALCLVLYGLLPSTKTVAAMIILPAVARNEQVQQLPDEVLAFIRSILREHTEKGETI